MIVRKKFTAIVLATILGITGIALPSTAFAGGPNYGRTWESSIGGIKVNGYVQIQASYNDGGRHARRGYQRFTRQAGPSLDTGRLYTSAASYSGDTQVRSRTDSVWDSVLWGDKYVTHYYWGVEYF
ncbi:hypothetical protein BREU_1672 [Bifidobacterium reuteri DSM 23975]|uniref:Lactococcin 972 family bacteriocin n=5 Tax=Bifidobacterium TaxID=1678 RepID=A0A087CTK9_9BIFI|nr:MULTISPECIES: hypothetical protein [Bifidobacterium]KAA8820172.1 hypothetical protein EMO90_06990 [Bifidobacterium vespertilionis]KAA8823903.1 hypothetical protein EM848_03660 [Bifidobacterium vespertilionis]KFI56228.1 hypothetical protein BCAL_0600 [Bifidobacterium callitrichos DSM 23973]KFI86609.1 hypothetical protein BREU_1672 [Bifidobacterium reuteri DSM 23975]MBT1179028.1 hypothetical protein [Bifidobacterium vespertilionis]